MDSKNLYGRIDEQINAATRKYDLPIDQLKFSTHMFKPDSSKLETIVTVEIGRKDNKTKQRWSILYFYNPRKCEYAKASKLESDIKKYIKAKGLKQF